MRGSPHRTNSSVRVDYPDRSWPPISSSDIASKTLPNRGVVCGRVDPSGRIWMAPVIAAPQRHNRLLSSLIGPCALRARNNPANLSLRVDDGESFRSPPSRSLLLRFAVFGLAAVNSMRQGSSNMAAATGLIPMFWPRWPHRCQDLARIASVHRASILLHEQALSRGSPFRHSCRKRRGLVRS